MTVAGSLAVLVAFAADLAVAEPPTRLHPVAWFGRAVGRVDREWAAPRLVGVVAAAGLPLVAAALVAGAVALAGRLGVASLVLAAGLALFVCTSLRMLLDEAGAVVSLTTSDLAAARDRLRSLAGRDPAALSAGEVRSAAVESAAENLADGLVAPLLAFALGATVSLPVAAGAAAWVKAVNTMDSMLGYRSTPTGWASARLDDVVMWLPARASAVLLAAAALDPDALGRGRRWARAPPSPNSGWPMATLAAALECRLVKPGVYDLHPIAPLPDPATARRGVRLVRRAGWLAVALVILVLAVTGTATVETGWPALAGVGW